MRIQREAISAINKVTNALRLENLQRTRHLPFRHALNESYFTEANRRAALSTTKYQRCLKTYVIKIYA